MLYHNYIVDVDNKPNTLKISWNLSKLWLFDVALHRPAEQVCHLAAYTYCFYGNTELTTNRGSLYMADVGPHVCGLAPSGGIEVDSFATDRRRWRQPDQPLLLCHRMKFSNGECDTQSEGNLLARGTRESPPPHYPGDVTGAAVWSWKGFSAVAPAEGGSVLCL